MKFLNIICTLKEYFLDFYFTKFSFIHFVYIKNNISSMKIQYNSIKELHSQYLRKIY